MAELVAVLGASHAPMMAAAPDSAPPLQRAAFFEGWASARALMGSLRPDVVVIVSNEHFTNFFLDNFPQVCIGLSDSHVGPAEPWLGIPQGPITGHAGLASHLLSSLLRAGHEPATSHRLRLDHGICTVYRQIDPSGTIPLVPIIQNCAVAPMPTLQRSFDLGVALGQAIRAWPVDARVVLVGAGGLSHWVGHPRVGDIDDEFDRWFLSALERGQLDDVMSLPDEELEQAGNGAHEIRSWLTAAGAASPAKARTLVYEPIAPWITGMGLVVFDA